MRPFWVLVVAACLSAQTQTGDELQLATRMGQLMESTAAVVPGLTRASEPVKQNAAVTIEGLQKTPANLALQYRLLVQVRAYLALSDSFARPESFPVVADQQFAELRDDTERMQRNFEAMLQVQNSQGKERNADPADLKRFAAENAQILPISRLPRVIFFGAAAVGGWRLNEYFTGRDFVNRGIAGQTSLQLLGRFMQDVIALKPKAVVILPPNSEEVAGVVENNLSTMGSLAKTAAVRALFGSIPPGDRSPAETRELNRWLQDYCRREGFVFIDYYAAVATPEGKLQPDLSDDGIRPSAKGYRLMSPIILDAINRTLMPNPEISNDAKQKGRFRLPGK